MKTKFMKAVALSLAILPLALASCSSKSTLTGKLSDPTAEVAIVNSLNDSIIASTKAVDGAFELSFEPIKDGNALYRVEIGDKRTLCGFIPEKGELLLDSDQGIVEGSPLNDKIANIIKEINGIFEEIQQEIEKGDNNQISPELMETINKKMATMEEKLSGFVLEHKESPVAIIALEYLRNLSGDLSRCENLVSALDEKLHAYPYVKMMEEQLKALNATKEGTIFTDLQGIAFTKDGGSEPVKLSEFAGQGQYTLVDFWASWCGPCRNEITNTLKPLYEKYRNKGLVVIGVAVWDKEEDHKKVVQELGIEWPQIFDPESDAMTQTYAIYGVPHIILVGPDGTILKRGLWGEDLVKAVENCFE